MAATVTWRHELLLAGILWALLCGLLCGVFLAGWGWYAMRDRRRGRRRGGELPDDLFRRIGGGT